jgi:hypothetical protein
MRFVSRSSGMSLGGDRMLVLGDEDRAIARKTSCCGEMCFAGSRCDRIWYGCEVGVIREDVQVPRHRRMEVQERPMCTNERGA